MCTFSWAPPVHVSLQALLHTLQCAHRRQDQCRLLWQPLKLAVFQFNTVYRRLQSLWYCGVYCSASCKSFNCVALQPSDIAFVAVCFCLQCKSFDWTSVAFDCSGVAVWRVQCMNYCNHSAGPCPALSTKCFAHRQINIALPHKIQIQIQVQHKS